MKFVLPMKWLLTLGFVLALAGTCQAQETRIAAVVNNDIVTADDVDAPADAAHALFGHSRYAAEPPAAPAPGAAAAHRREARDAGSQALQGRRRQGRDRESARQYRGAQHHAERRARSIPEGGRHSAQHPGRPGHRLAHLEQGGRGPLLLGCQRLRYRGRRRDRAAQSRYGQAAKPCRRDLPRDRQSDAGTRGEGARRPA